MSAPTPEDVTPRRPEPRDLRRQASDLASDVHAHVRRLGRKVVHVVVAPDLGAHLASSDRHPVVALVLADVPIYASDDQRPGTYLLVLEGPL